VRLAERSAVRRHAEITVFNDHVEDPAGVIERLHSFDAICVMRERTPLRSGLAHEVAFGLFGTCGRNSPSDWGLCCFLQEAFLQPTPPE